MPSEENSFVREVSVVMKNDGRSGAAVPDPWEIPFSEAERKAAREWRERLRAAEEKYREALRDAESDRGRRKAILEAISDEVGPVPEMYNMTAATMTPLIAALVRIDEEKRKMAARPAALQFAGTARRTGLWVCSRCGRRNTGNFCSECGAKRP